MSARAKLVEVRRNEVFTTSTVIAENCDVKHEATIKLVRKFLSDLQDVGLVRFEIQARLQGRHGGGNTEIAILDDYATMLLLTHMRSNEVVRKFKLALVREFKRMRSILSEPGRKAELAGKRNTAIEMTDAIKFIRETVGKETSSRHYVNEHLFCNRALTGAWEPLDEADLDSYDTRLLGAIRRKNTLLMTRYQRQSDRRALLDEFVADYRAKHPRLALVAPENVPS
jgi:phage regulator Rha-like protein